MLGHNILDSGTSSTDKHFEEHMQYNRKESETWYEEEEKKAQPYLKLIHESSHVFKDSGRERGKKENDKKKYCQVQSVQRSSAALMFFFPSVFC